MKISYKNRYQEKMSDIKDENKKRRRTKKGPNGSTLAISGSPRDLLLSVAAIFEAQAKSTAEFAAQITSYAEQMPVVPKGGLVGKDGKRRRRAKPADPNAPKKPMTAYQAYVSGNMERVKAEEGISNVQAMSRLAELWKIMPEEDKNDYHETAKVMKNKYVQQLNAYNNGTVEPEDDEEPKKGKAKKGGKRK